MTIALGLTGVQCTAKELQERIQLDKEDEEEAIASSKGKVKALLEAALQSKIDALEDIEAEQGSAASAAVSRPSQIAAELQHLTELQQQDNLDKLVEDRVQLFHSRSLLFASLVLNM